MEVAAGFFIGVTDTKFTNNTGNNYLIHRDLSFNDRMNLHKKVKKINHQNGMVGDQIISNKLGLRTSIVTILNSHVSTS